MNDYRPLTSEEIEVLKSNDCWAEDWTSVNVAEDFKPNFMHRVMLYGEVNIGAFNKNVEVSQGFVKHAGINNATLRNVTIGDDCLIENVGNFINNYTIGDDCYISNISTMETTEGATYGEGNLVSVLNEVGEGNMILFSDLNSQLAAFMVKHFSDKDLKEKIRQLIKTDIDNKMPERGQIGNNVKIVNTKEITNCIINDFCEVNGAARLSDCTLLGSAHGNVYRHRRHCRELDHRRGRIGYQQREDTGLLRGRSVPAEQRFYGIHLYLLRQQLHEQRRGMCRLLWSIHRIAS